MKSITELMDLSSKTAIVTGGAKGIGLAIASRLAEAGASVLIADLDETAAGAAAQELVDNDLRVAAMKVDVAQEADIQAMIARCVKEFGGLDILVNNAGIYPAMTIEAISLEQFQHVIDTNLVSVFLSTKYGAEVMKQKGGGRIINVTSIDALHPSMVGLAHYDASKHGVWGFTKNSALELAQHGITVNAIAPGGITTPGVASMSQGASAEQMAESTKLFMAKIPMHRMGEPDEIGKVALFLASDMSSYMTGSQIVVDGGALLS